MVEEWAHSGAGLWLLSVGGGGRTGQSPSPPSILSPHSQPPLVGQEVRLGLLQGHKALGAQRQGRGGPPMP